MNNRKTIVSALLAAMCISPAMAQKIEVNIDNVDCGEVMWNRPVTVRFECKNTSSKKLKIKKVKPDCGCTTVDFPKEVPGGETFFITAVYDAQTLGHFYRQVEVTSNATQKPIYLAMSGVVSATVKDYSSTFPVQMGPIRLNRSEIVFDDVNSGDVLSQEIEIINTSRKTYTPTVMHLPSYLSARYVPEKLGPEQTGVVYITLDSKKLRDYGLTQTNVYMARFPGDKVSEETSINVSAILLPDFKHQDQGDQIFPPKMQMTADSVFLGEFGKKSKLSQTIEITNTGKKTLNITSLQMFTLGLKVALSKSNIEPGETAKLKITGERDQLKKERRAPRVLMITNDPERAKVIIPVYYK